MIKTRAVLEVKSGDRVYEFTCAHDAPLGEVHSALMQMKAYVVQQIVAAEKAEEKPKE